MALCFSAAGAVAADFSLKPAVVAQGNTVRVTGPSSVAAIEFNGKKIPVYPQESRSEGLLPAPVLLKPGAYEVIWTGQSGDHLHSETLRVRDAHYPSQNIVLNKALTSLHATPEEREDVGTFLERRSADRYWREPLQPPVGGCITSPFGVRRLHNGKPTGDFHAGLDQRGAAGTPVHAITGGLVQIAQQFELRGGTVAIDHGQGMQSIYLHMSKIAAKPGERVAAGEVIGYVGSTGRSTGPHLHWTLYVQGEPVNPLQWVQLSPCRAASIPHAKVP